MKKTNYNNAKHDNPIDSVDIDPFGDNIGTRMEVQMSGIIADLLLKLHNILPFANNGVIERYLVVLEAYFDPYLSTKEKDSIENLDKKFTEKLSQYHPKDVGRHINSLYTQYIEDKLKILMNCAYKQDMLPGRIKTMKPL